MGDPLYDSRRGSRTFPLGGTARSQDSGITHMGDKRFVGAIHLTCTALLMIGCLVVGFIATHAAWPFGTFSAVLLISTLLLIGLLFSWRGIANLRASEDLYLLAQVRKMGGRITADELAARAHRNLMRVTRFLECKVKRGQAVMFAEEGEITYIFDGFVDHSGKDLAFKL